MWSTKSAKGENMITKAACEILCEVQKDILANPEGFAMDCWSTCLVGRAECLGKKLKGDWLEFGDLIYPWRWPRELDPKPNPSVYETARAIDWYIEHEGEKDTPELIPADFSVKEKETVEVG